MANFIKIVNEAHTKFIYSTVELEEVCIIEYKKDKQFGYISFNVEYMNDDKLRSAHYIDGITALFDYNSPIYNYAISIYKKAKALDKRLIDDGTQALGEYDYGNAVIKYLRNNKHGLSHTRNKADYHMAKAYGIIQFIK